MAHLEEGEAIWRITHNGGKVEGKCISIDAPGLKVLAAIDCLVHYYGFRRVEIAKGYILLDSDFN